MKKKIGFGTASIAMLLGVLAVVWLILKIQAVTITPNMWFGIWIVLSLYISGFVFASLHGFYDAHYYDLIPSEREDHKNLHYYFVALRITFWTVSSIPVFYETYFLRDFYYWPIGGLLFIFCQWWAFSFWHNGVYGIVRNNLEPTIYKKRFWSDKEKSKIIDPKKAKFEIEVGFRIAMFIFSIIGIVITVAYILNQPCQ